MKFKGYLWGCVSSATYGLIPLFGLPVLRKAVSYDSLLFYRFSCAAILLALIMFLRKESFKVTKKEVVPLIILGILFALSAQFLFWSYSFLSVGLASTILFTYPIFVAILMAVLFKERISRTSQLAIVVAFSGVCLLYQGDVSINVWGLCIILLSALFYAIFIIVVNKSPVKNMQGEKLIFYALSISACFFFIQAQVKGGVQILPDTESVINIIMLATIPTVVSCIAMVYAVQHIGSTSTAVLGALEPVTAVAVGVFAFNEVFSLNLAIGICFILTAVLLIIMSGRIEKIARQRSFHNK